MNEPITYQKSGVDPDKAAKILGRFASFQKGRPKDPMLLSGIGPYASCYSLKEIANQFKDPLLVTSCDGVGTKVKLALDWNLLDGLGQDLVAMNVNDLLCVGAKPLLFLDYYACGSLREEQLLPLLQSIQKGCELAGCSLAGGETAEMPGMYQKDDFDLAGFAVGVVDRIHALGSEKVVIGDSIVGIASSGLHSNGFSLVRKLLERESLNPNEKTPWGNRTWRETLLAPTHIYVKDLLPWVPKLHALAHITGGGLFENLPRVLPDNSKASISSSAWKMPPLFQWIQEKAGIAVHDMLSTLNCGIGMLAILPDEEVSSFLSEMKSKGHDVFVVGKMAAHHGKATVEWK